MHQVQTTGTHGHGQGHPGSIETTQEPSLLRSDAALLAAVKAGDAAAARRLHDRHAPAVEITADLVGADAPATSWAGLLADLTAGQGVTLPVRATWLAGAVGHELGAEDEVARSTDAVWAAYTALSTTWQTALWHHEVEGEQLDGVGRVLGCLPEDAATSVANAGMSLRRAVVASHECGPRAECRAVVDQVRVDPHPELPTRLVRSLREHARHCDECLPLVRDTFRVAFGLREILAAHVLGPYSEEYLRSRVERAARAAASPRALAPSVRRTGRSVLTVGAVGLTAAAVAGALVIHPSALPSNGAGTHSASVSISLPGAAHAGKHAGHRGQIRLAAAHLPQHVTGATTGKHAATTKGHAGSSTPSAPSAPSGDSGSTPTAPSTPPSHPGKPGTGDGGTTPTGPTVPTPPSGSSDPTPPSDPSPVHVSGGKGTGTTVSITPPAGSGLPSVSVTVPPVSQVVGAVGSTVTGATGAAGSAVSGTVSGTVSGVVSGLGGGHHG